CPFGEDLPVPTCHCCPPADPQWYPARQSLRLDPKGRSLKDEDVLQSLPVGTTATFYFRDLGAQISWVTVFLTEYAGPLLIYLLFYFRVPFLYGPRYDFTASRHAVVQCVRGSWGVLEEVWGAIKGPGGGTGSHWMGLGGLKGSLGEERGPGGGLRILGRLKGTTGRSWKGFQGSFGGVLG
uniref:Trans-2,3-enoyl-CoA reductase n=1 Tax=Chrysolophus pictus TaxID=9089 RepID=A0A8C3LUE9_CHRPC